MARSSGSALMLAAILAAIAFVSAVPAQAANLQCGDVITQDTKLDNDLLDCPGNGVVIGADSITLDLNGHLVDGVPSHSLYGVDTAGHDRVSIENGSVQQFNVGVAVQGTDDSGVTGTHIRDTYSGIRLQYSNRNRIARNSASGYGYAIELADDAQSNLVEHNRLDHSGNGVMLKPIDNPPDHPPLPPRNNRIVGNVVSENIYGIFVWWTHSNSIERNSISSNSAYGVYITFTSAANSLIKNDVFNNGDGVFVVGQAEDTVISRNHIQGSDGDGLEIRTRGRGTTVIERNVSNGNGDDGIDVGTAAATITQNRTNDNADLGIDAVPGVSDGGGNKARGNGNPAQCQNITCK